MNSRNFCGSIDSSNFERVAALIKAMLDRRLFVMTEYYPHYRVTGMGLVSDVRYLTNQGRETVNFRSDSHSFITVCDSGGVWQITPRDHVVIDSNNNTIIVERNNGDYTAVFKIRPVPQQMIDDFAGMEER